ncbi:MAG: DMT family transporter [Sphingomonadaceae bacterium]|nr:DMT family transporter [Sphingomonadaceae bacterium]
MGRLTIAALATVAIMGFAGNSLLTRAALGNGLIGPGSFTAIRLGAGAVVLMPWLLRGEREWPNWRGPLLLLVYCAAFSFAYVELNTATGAMVLFAAVQITILAAGRLAGAHTRAVELAGIALAMTGVAVLLGTKAERGPVFAVLMMTLAGLAWGLYSILGRSAADPARRTAGNFLIAAVLAAPLALFDIHHGVTASGVLLAIASGALASGLGYVAWYMVVPRLPHSTIGTAQLATPVIAAIAAAVLLSEPLTLRLTVAALLILGGIAATLWRH